MEKLITSGPGHTAKIKYKKISENSSIYVFDVYDEYGKLISVNRYAFVENIPFEPLSKAEDCVILKQKPDADWLVADIKAYMDLSGIEYDKETKTELLMIINPAPEYDDQSS